LWKNCRNILRALDRQRSREELWKNCPGAKSYYNFSTILPRWLFTLVRKQRFYGNFVEKLVEEFGACQIRGRIFLAAAD
jgi:hypothetical protein